MTDGDENRPKWTHDTSVEVDNGHQIHRLRLRMDTTPVGVEVVHEGLSVRAA